MPTINTFRDPRYQAVADFFSVLQYQRLQSEIRNAERVARQQRLVGTLGGAVVGGIGGAFLGPAIGGTTILAGAAQGAGLGGMVGSQIVGGDVAGGVATAAEGIGTLLQKQEDIQQFGFAPTKLDRSEISKLATSLGTTTRAFTAQAKAEGIPLEQYAGQVAQQQAAQRAQSVFEGQMAQQLGASREVITEAGQGDFQAGAERIRGVREQERQQRGRADAQTRMNAALQKAGILNNFDMVPDEQEAHKAVRNYNAVMGDPNVPQGQRLELLNRIAGDIEDPSNFPMKLVRKQPPSAAEQVKQAQPILEAWMKAGFKPRLSIGRDGEMTVSVDTLTDRDTDIEIPSLGVSIPRAQYLNRLNENYALGVSTLGTMTPTREQMQQAYETAERVTVRGLLGTSPENMERMIQEEMERQQFPEEMTANEAATKLKAAVQKSPNIETWPPEKIEQHRDEARVVFDFYVSLLEGGRQLDETQQRELEIAKRILEQ